MDISMFIAPLATSLMTGVGVYVAITQRIAVLETKMDTIAERVDKHNSMVERTYKLENNAVTQEQNFCELKERVKILEGKK